MTLTHPLFRLLCLAMILPTTASAEGTTRRPNVVILLTDDQGTLDANCYGSADLKTPNMDKLASTGTRFTQAYAHTVCCPSRAALYTGRHPQRGGVINWTQGDRHGTDRANINMAAEEVTLAEVLKSAGYRTALFGKWHLGAKIGHGPLDQGFETYFGHLGGFIDNYRHFFLHGRGYHDLYEGNDEVFRREEYYPDLMTEKAVAYIDKNKDAPFFLTVAFNLPHYPEQPIAAFKDTYADMPMPRQAYARVISSVDAIIGRVIDKLEQTGLRDDTIVIMMSDNGHSTEDNKGIAVENHTSGYPVGHYYLAHGGGGNTGKWIGHKGQFLEGGIRVPAMISYPAKLPRGQTREQVVPIMDWFPTVLELCGIQKETGAPKLDGRTMIPVIADPKAPSAHEVLHFGWANGWAVRKGDWKLISTQNKTNGKVTKASLHNLTGPEPEAKDHAAEHPEIVAQLTALHEAWEKDVNPK
ncbi:sulfatase-like hydrolase/transferase [Humisphaera borealis]|uniref:Sulfatase-like hydrolase/transferase n=1 Tax=Humisphaera borealis TaxID=2807512 RepID=A0A7M2WYK7_9BACT|nr:sulfatase-like hydrolase/transferase [Humisphaera borealis]QOV90578.1 sulfatase-like hydrolase/transferase [Humisphaera borealis]